jgi:transcriptional regulator with XRE-family HTH domain
MTKAKQPLKQTGTEASAQDYAARFGALVRERREALKLRQEDIVFTTGIGRRFIIELEAGKPSCQLGKALLVAAAVGLRPFDLMAQDNADNALLPDMPETAEEPARD